MSYRSIAPRAASHAVVDRHADEYTVWGYQNVDMVLWTRAPTVTGIERFHALIPRRLSEAGASRLSVVHVGLASARLPSLDARSAFTKVARKWRSAIGALAVVVEQEGWVGSTLRGLAAGIVVLSGQRLTMRIASHVGEAAAWLPEPHLRETGVALDPAELYDVLTEIRACSALRASASA
ncbi:MAG: hypothetical protein ABW252_14925 [Polyangiales bacterium]